MVFIMSVGGANCSSHANMEHWQPPFRCHWDCYVRKTTLNIARFNIFAFVTFFIVS